MNFPANKPSYDKEVDSNVGYFNPVHLEMFSKYAHDIESYLEVGSDCGRSALWVAENTDAKIVCIDPWAESWTAAHQALRKKELKNLGDRRLNNFFARLWDYQDRVTVIREKSSRGLMMAKEFNFEPDMVYIDGNHEHDAVLLDLFLADECFPYAQLCGDDYEYVKEWDCVAVEEAVLDFCKLRDYNVETFTHPTSGRKRCFGVIKP